MENVVSSVFICRTWVCHVGSETSFVISCSVWLNFSAVSHRSRLQYYRKAQNNNNNQKCSNNFAVEEDERKWRSEHKTYWWFFSCCHILRQFFRLHNIYNAFPCLVRCSVHNGIQFSFHVRLWNEGTFDENQANKRFSFFYGFLTAQRAGTHTMHSHIYTNMSYLVYFVCLWHEKSTHNFILSFSVISFHWNAIDTCSWRECVGMNSCLFVCVQQTKTH